MLSVGSKSNFLASSKDSKQSASGSYGPNIRLDMGPQARTIAALFMWNFESDLDAGNFLNVFSLHSASSVCDH